MMRNEQGKNDETRTGEDAGSPARGRVAQEQASESVRNNAQVSIRTLIDEIARLPLGTDPKGATMNQATIKQRALALFVAAHNREPDSVRETNGAAVAIGEGYNMATIGSDGSTIATSKRPVTLATDREALEQWCRPRGTSTEDAARAYRAAKARYIKALQPPSP